MISLSVPTGMYPSLAYDGKETFSGVLQSFFTVIDETEQNIGISRKWKDTTATQYARDYSNRILPAILRLFGPEKPMHEYTAEDFELILSELKKKHHYAEEKIRHYRYLLRVTYYAGVDNGMYADQLFWEEILDDFDDPEQHEKHRIAAMTRTRKSFSVQEDIKLLLYFLSLKPNSASGEDIGLMLMYFLGIRNNEACGTDYSAIRLMSTHPERAVYDMLQTTVIGGNKVKSGGKTGNAPRTLPLHMWVYDFLEDRKTWIKEELAAGNIALPDGLNSVDQLPIVCKGDSLTIRAHTTDLSRAGRALFELVGIAKSELAVLQQILFSEDFRGTQIEEKDPTTYLLRRNVATRLYNLGFEWTTIQYWIAHEIEDALLRRNFFADEEVLYEIGIAYERHPIFAILKDVTRGVSVKKTENSFGKYFTQSSETDATYLIRVKALEPGSAIATSIRSNNPIRIVQTDIPLDELCKSIVDIGELLQRLYWNNYKQITKK